MQERKPIELLLQIGVKWLLFYLKIKISKQSNKQRTIREITFFKGSMALPPFYISIVQEAYPFRVLMTFLCLNYQIKKVVNFTTDIKAIYTEKAALRGRLNLH